VTALVLPPIRGRNRSKPAERATPQLLVNAVQFCAWVAQASPGYKLEYHRGLLALDASEFSRDFAGPRRRELNRVAHRASWAANQGLVHLVQRRNGPDDFSYIAIARLHADDIPQPLSSVLLKEVA
jgi:hypothetical protein